MIMLMAVVSSAEAFVTTRNKIISPKIEKLRGADVSQQHMYMKTMDSVITATIVATAPVVVESTLKQVIAKSLGYLIGLGAMALYSPIIIKLVRTKDAEGFSLQTWIFNIFGLGAQLLYNYKRGFHISTYLELIITVTQSIGILGLVSSYSGKGKEYIGGMAATAGLVALLAVADIPLKVLGIVQLASIIACNYALIPQILLSFKTKKTAWSWITSSLSLIGCLLRIFTTMTLTKDPLVLAGFTVGAVNNLTLLLQIYFYRNN